PLNACQSACLIRSRFAAPAWGHWNFFENGSVSWMGGYGCMLNSSKIGAWRPETRYATPMSLMNRTGEWLGLDAAFALSVPRDQSRRPPTRASRRAVSN